MIPRFERPGGAPLLLVGLTGGIATGKSTVSGMFRELGAVVLDADAIVHRLLDPGGAAVEAVTGAFGEEVRSPAHGVDRAKLAAIIFRNEHARRRLEAIVHPLVMAESNSRLTGIAAADQADLVLYDAALLVETGRHADFHRLIVVVTIPEVQIQRLMARDHLDADEAGTRIRAQSPLARKVAVADYVIDNSIHWGETRRQVAEVWRFLLEDARRLREGRPLPARHGAPGRGPSSR